MSKKIIITQEQYNRLNESKRKTIIIDESQLGVLREYENNKVLRYEFETKVRKYMEELKDNPCKPLYDSFFKKHDIPEDVLQNKMLDLGIIKKSDKINEPMDADGKKHSVHSRKFIFSSSGFDDKIDKLYGHFFKNGERVLSECDCGGAIGGDCSAGGATNAEGVGGQYTVPFGGVQRRKIGVSGSTESNVDMSPALDRPKGKIAVNRVK
jgi:hypothetical protein